MSTFSMGFLGSIFVEIGAAWKSTQDLEGRCPERYKEPFYLFIRLLMALAAGAIPTFLEAANPTTALYMGASAPLFLDRLGRGVDPTNALMKAGAAATAEKPDGNVEDVEA
ncbi:hypothetical protein [Rhizobium binxianense]|uniref:hypothetical protein n=1 Tax=Rhizobium binxianense TaxID=3024242 RepID=UPI00235F9DD9|nr:hypothetical protein [Rhizobium sp. MJ37]MDC9834331.1 hypothetical protein [Rhizobium sp. MJ37]